MSLDGLVFSPGSTGGRQALTMLSLRLPSSRRPCRILCIGAHCDDIEIGCGGTLLRWQAATIDWAVLTGDARRRAETALAMKKLLKPAQRGTLEFGEFPDARLPAHYGEAKDFFALLRRRTEYDVVFCHERDDAHQDHRIVNELTWSAFRDHLVLEYEIPKWDGNYARPNAYVPLPAAVARRKVDVLMAAYGTQRGKDWFSEDTFMALMRLRGNECRAPGSFAEAFTARKLQISME